MKRWTQILPVALTAIALLSGSLLVQPAHSEDGGRKQLFFFSSDFPPNPAAQVPVLPIQETQFWQLLDRETKATDDLAVTENMEKADYRVDLRCGGVMGCSKLVVDIRNPERDVLGSFTIKNVKGFLGLEPVKLDLVARQLTQKLDERFKQLDQGGYGHAE